MAQRYGKRAPAGAGWDLLAESLQDALTEPQQKPVPSPQSQSRLPVVSVILAIILVVTFPITMVVVNSWLGQFALIMWIAFILGVVALATVQLVIRRREDRPRSSSTGEDRDTAQAKTQSKVRKLIDDAKRGDFSGFSSIPEARPIAAECYAKQQVGLAMDADLPNAIQTAHDVAVCVSESGAEIVRASKEQAVETLTSTLTSTVSTRFADALASRLRARNSDTIDHMVATSAGVIVAATHHWPGTLSLDDEGRFSAGPNHPANEYRQASVSALAAMADEVCNGEVALILLIIADGFVLGSGVETEVNGHRIIAIEREHAVDFIAHVHAQGTLAQVPDLRLIDERSPQLTM
ncbi:hypothetical protein CGLAU_05980 [Corynebacterium glaucum]|uniref:Uncharacterized protein n=1 Tax=Corynebacterium glaucum TaxID=187491 RepID=A0A1Q2HWE6_9CORY|nr:hypothetical protein [Corynebacterium glaucum]AQQ15163.1 hypothetical protein CGLAU_05980 [Corynebacterium glaucum]